MPKSITARTLMVLGFSTCAAAAGWAQQDNQTEQQTQQQMQQQAAEPEIALETWTYDDLYADGWSVEALMDDAEVHGPTGDEIGSIENVIFDENNQIAAVIAEVGGFWDITDTHVAVPWDEVTLGVGAESIEIPVTEENVEDYDPFGDTTLFTRDETQNTQVVNSDLYTGPRLWKATEVIGDDALLSDNAGFGYIDDLIVNENGTIEAVVVDSTVGYGTGPYAYPFHGYGYGFRPADPYYTLPYDEDDVAELEPFDEERLEGDQRTEAGDEMEQTDTAAEQQTAGDGTDQ